MAALSGLALIEEPDTGNEFFRPITNPDLSFKDIVLPSNVPLVAGTANPLYLQGAAGDPWWMVNNSLMQRARTRSASASSG